MCYLLAIVEEIYKFRNGHWQFVQKYIMANTKYAKATGGTPIISWIPNQIKSVLSYIEVILNELHSMNRNFNLEQNKIYTQSANTLQAKLKLLDKQLIIVSDSNYNPGKVFELNKKFKLEDTNIEKKVICHLKFVLFVIGLLHGEKSGKKIGKMSSIVVKDAEETKSLVWFRNDLRINDNLALNSALSAPGKVIGFYCFNSSMFKMTNLGFPKIDKFRAKFLLETIENLKEDLKKINITLIITIGDPVEELMRVISQQKIKNIFFQKEWTQEEVDEEDQLKSKYNDKNFKSFYSQFLYDPDDLDINNISNVFTNFRKHCEKKLNVKDLVEYPKKLLEDNLLKDDYLSPSLSDLGLEDFEIDSRSAFKFKGGYNAAKERLDFLSLAIKKDKFL